MDLVQSPYIAIGCLISFVLGRIFPLHLNRPNYLMAIWSSSARYEIEPAVSVRKVHVPPSVGHQPGHIQLGKIVRIFITPNTVEVVSRRSCLVKHTPQERYPEVSGWESVVALRRSVPVNAGHVPGGHPIDAAHPEVDGVSLTRPKHCWLRLLAQ